MVSGALFFVEEVPTSIQFNIGVMCGLVKESIHCSVGILESYQALNETCRQKLLLMTCLPIKAPKRFQDLIPGQVCEGHLYVGCCVLFFCKYKGYRISS